MLQINVYYTLHCISISWVRRYKIRCWHPMKINFVLGRILFVANLFRRAELACKMLLPRRETSISQAAGEILNTRSDFVTEGSSSRSVSSLFAHPDPFEPPKSLSSRISFEQRFHSPRKSITGPWNGHGNLETVFFDVVLHERTTRVPDNSRTICSFYFSCFSCKFRWLRRRHITITTYERFGYSNEIFWYWQQRISDPSERIILLLLLAFIRRIRIRILKNYFNKHIYRV